MQAAQDVQMVFNGVDAIEVTVLVADDAPDVAEQFFSAVCAQNGLPILRREYDAIVNLSEGGHGVVPSSTPPRLNRGWIDPRPRVAPGAIHIEALRASSFFRISDFGFRIFHHTFTFASVSFSALAELWRPIISFGHSLISTCFSTPLRPTTDGRLKQMSRIS